MGSTGRTVANFPPFNSASHCIAISKGIAWHIKKNDKMESFFIFLSWERYTRCINLQWMLSFHPASYCSSASVLSHDKKRDTNGMFICCTSAHSGAFIIGTIPGVFAAMFFFSTSFTIPVSRSGS